MNRLFSDPARLFGSAAMSPLSALVRGVLAGAIGSLAQDLFFKATAKIAPPTPQDIFTPPEAAQRNEMATQTVARRLVEGVMRRGPIKDKERAGRIVHYAFGAAWGGLYGLAAASFPRARSLLGGLAFGLGVWVASDDLLLPAFGLAAPPAAYPAKTHAYAIAAHFAYGAAVAGAFSATRRSTWVALLATAGAAWKTRALPKPIRRPARRVLARVSQAANMLSSMR